MMRHTLTIAEKLAGVRAALASDKTPVQLRSGLEKYFRHLQAELARKRRRGRGLVGKVRRKAGPGFLDWFQ